MGSVWSRRATTAQSIARCCKTLMHSLTLLERNVIALRFEHDLTQAEIGARIGVSQMQISRILRQSLARLRTIAEARS